MTKFSYRLDLLALVISSLTLAACSKQPAPPAATADKEVVEEEVVEQVEVPDVETGDVTQAMADLSDADRAAALAQKTCPVSDEPLGSMGTPIKVTVNGRDVFLCCNGCRKELEANPDKYLAKLPSPELQPAK
ncbi:MAG: hypothetical protein AB7G28_06035 [Pirellulales bacterium]